MDTTTEALRVEAGARLLWSQRGAVTGSAPMGSTPVAWQMTGSSAVVMETEAQQREDGAQASVLWSVEAVSPPAGGLRSAAKEALRVGMGVRRHQEGG
mmetsp:Transcript_29940/g.61564  ORF Transcript_29940/g.61564 Transcript_29940/m.61564 type:complete len:98 (+) Transcript_29940:1090-1383(+)